MTRNEKANRHLDRMIEDADHAIAKFIINLETNAAYAFEWSDDAVKAAARRDIALRAKEILNHEKGGFAVLFKEANDAVLQGARMPKRSTSTMTNLVEQEKLAAWADMVSDFTNRGYKEME